MIWSAGGDNSKKYHLGTILSGIVIVQKGGSMFLYVHIYMELMANILQILERSFFWYSIHRILGPWIYLTIGHFVMYKMIRPRNLK